jgi:aspartate aminotransferase
VPQNNDWFAYKTSEAEPQAFLAERLSQELDLAFDPNDIALTNGGFAAISVAFWLLLNAGDEAIISGDVPCDVELRRDGGAGLKVRRPW